MVLGRVLCVSLVLTLLAARVSAQVPVLRSDCLMINSISGTQHHLAIELGEPNLAGPNGSRSPKCKLVEMTVDVYKKDEVDGRLSQLKQQLDATKAESVPRVEHEQVVTALLRTITLLEARLKVLEDRLAVATGGAMPPSSQK